MSGYNKSYGRSDERQNDQREAPGFSRDETRSKSSDSSLWSRDHRPDRDFRDRDSAQSRSREQSLGSSSNDHSRAQAPDLNIMKVIVEWTTLLVDSAVERFDQRNLEKACEKTNADYRKSAEKHSEFPGLVHLQKQTNEDALRKLAAIKKRREHADSLLLKKAENICELICELIETRPSVEVQTGARDQTGAHDNTCKDSDATGKDLDAVRKNLESIRRDLEFKNASHMNTVQQSSDAAKKGRASMQKEIEQLQRELRGIGWLKSDELGAKIDELKSSFERRLEDQKQLYENKLAQETIDMKQYIDDALEKRRREYSAKETENLRNQQSAQNELMQRLAEQEKKIQGAFQDNGQAAEHHALRQQVTAQEKQIKELIEDKQRLAKLEEKIKGLEAQQKAHSENTLTQFAAVRGDIHELQQESRKTSSSVELAAVRAEFAELQRKTEERDEVLSTRVTTLSNSAPTRQPVATTDLADIDGLRQRIGAVEAKVGNADISGLDLNTLDDLAEWYTMHWPGKKAEIVALSATIKKLGAGTTLLQGLSVGDAEMSAQVAAELRAELADAGNKMKDGLKKTMDLCREIVKGESERVDDLTQLLDANSITLKESRAETDSWKARLENQHQDFVNRMQKVEEELRGSIDVCRFSIEALDSQFNNLSTRNLATLILSHLEQLHPNSTRLDADHQWLRNKMDALENDFQGLKRQLEDINHTDDDAIALSHEHADGAMMINPGKKRRLSVATNGGA